MRGEKTGRKGKEREMRRGKKDREEVRKIFRGRERQWEFREDMQERNKGVIQ